MPKYANPFMERWGDSSDSEWLTALINACDTPLVDGIHFPTLPDVEVQRTIQGNSAEIAVRGSVAFYRTIRDTLSAHAISFTETQKLLDFGTGWGRIIRPFMRDFQLENLYAVEPETEWCLTARRCNPYITVLQSDFMPPLPFRDQFFDYIIAYSIFTHLPEDMFNAWFREFERLVRPGGIVAFTFLGDRTIAELKKYARPLSNGQDVHFWHRILIDALEKDDPKGDRYESDEFIFLNTGMSSQYGDTFVSPRLVRKLLKEWNIISIDSTSLAQDMCVMQRCR